MVNVKLLDKLLRELLVNVPSLIAALVVDAHGLIITKQSIRGLDDEKISAIMGILDRAFSSIKRISNTSLGSGTLDTEEFNLFYVELKGEVSALFVLIADQYTNINQFIPYYYFIAEKVSQILHNEEPPLTLLKIDSDGKIKFRENGQTQNIVIIGDASVGKSSLIKMYTQGSFMESYIPTVGVSILEQKLQISKNLNINFNLIDMSGLTSLAKIRRYYYRNIKAVILVFDYSRQETLGRISNWIEEAQHFIEDNKAKFALVGNKIDLIEGRNELRTEAQNIANQYGFWFYETSACTGEGLDELFTTLISNCLI